MSEEQTPEDKTKSQSALLIPSKAYTGLAMPSIVGDDALLRAFCCLEPFSSAVLAVSGGPDSVALMHLARRWAKLTGRDPASLAVVTVDHGLRSESASEAAFVAGEARALGLAHHTLPWAGEKPKTGIQAAARQARYDLLAEYCAQRSIGCVAVAHTADDQAETFLMRLRRGSGVDGLAAMAAVSERGAITLVRPLLSFSKARTSSAICAPRRCRFFKTRATKTQPSSACASVAP